MMPRSRRQPTSENPFRTLPPKCVFKARSLHVIEEGKKKRKRHSYLIVGQNGWQKASYFFFFFFWSGGWCIHTSSPTSCRMEWREQSDLSSDVAAIFTHGGSCRLVCTALYDISRQALPVKWFHFVFFLPLPSACMHVQQGNKRSAPEEVATQAEKNENSVLPINTMWLFFNAFNPASSPPSSCHPLLPALLTSSPSSYPPLTAREQKGLSGLYPPLLPASLSPPLSDHFILHPGPHGLHRLLPPSLSSSLPPLLPPRRLSLMFLPPPLTLQRVP